MYDTNALVRDFQATQVALTQPQYQDMQKRRDTNLGRLNSGLKELDKPAVAETINQGGNAMRTMTQPPEGDEETRYDIDVGAVFEEADAKTPVTTKTWVRDAIKKKGMNFKTEPTLKKKCVRVVYKDGYQVDLPVFRRKVNGQNFTYEIAIGDEWTASDPKAINKWFEDRIQTLSPDSGGGYQLRRIVRLLKYFAKVRSSRTGTKFPAGLVATALAVECYQAVKDRDDEAFYLTLKKLRDRSEYLPVIANGTEVSDAKDQDRIKRLRDAAGDAVDALAPLVDDEAEMTEERARRTWKRVFSHSYFDSEKAAKAMSEAASISGTDVAAPAVILGLTAEERLKLAKAKADETSTPTRPWAR